MNKLELPFDLYTRNFLISKLVEAIRYKAKLKILDVGGRGGQLKNFFEEDEYYILDLLNDKQKEKGYIIGDIRDAPFKSNLFDVVISSDLYEHILPEDRLMVVSEMLRLSKNFIILGAPFYSKEVEEAEAEVRNFFLKITGKHHIYLEEHVKNGLPSHNELETFLNKNGYGFQCYETNNISNWLLLQFFTFYAYAYGIPPQNVARVYKYYNENFIELGDFLQPTYRKIYLIGKGKLPSLSRKSKLEINKNIDLLKYHKLLSLIFDCIGNHNLRKDNHIKNLNRIINDLNNHIQLKEKKIFEKDNHIKNLESTLSNIQNSITWQLLKKYQGLIEKILPLGTKRRHVYDLALIGLRIIINEGWSNFWPKFKKILFQKIPFLKLKDPYRIWILKNEPPREKLEEYKKEALSFKYRPKISIITPVWNTDKRWLRKCIESVLNQVYDNWELCIVDGGSSKPHIKKILDEYAKKESRIKIKFLPENKGIAGNSNEALSLATGEFVCLLDHDDELAPFALYEVVKLLNEKPHLDFIYSDEDKIDEKEKRKDPFFKPDWSPDMFLSYNYICHLAIIRKKIIDKIGGFREGFEGSQDYDLFLRVIELTDKIAHIPKVLYHWRMVPGSAASHAMAKPYAIPNAKRAISEFLKKRGIEAKVEDGLFPTSYRIRYKILKDFKVSIIIPTRDKVEILSKCISSILEKTTYPHYEIIIVDNQSKEESTFRYFKKIKKDPRIRIISFNHPFNFSAINNFAAKEAEGEVLLFLNNDIEVINSDWLASMLEHCQRKEVGAVGAKLYYPNNTIQHGGVILGLGGVAGHSHKYFPRDSDGYMKRLKIVQNLSAVTAACMMMRKEVFLEVNGFDENLKVAFNDVDLCLRIREKGYLVVYTPYAKLYHYESLTRGYEDNPEKQARFLKEVQYIRQKWGYVIDKGDPYYNPNLTLEKEDFSIKI